MGRVINLKLRRRLPLLILTTVCVLALLQILQRQRTFILSTHEGANRDVALIDTVFQKYGPDSTATGFLQDGLGDYRVQIDKWKSHIPARPDQALVYMCIKGGCGGIADRQEGIVAGFLLASLTGRNFYIVYRDKCPLSDYYVPNKIDWRIPKAILSRLQLGNFQQMIAYDEEAFKLGELLAQTNLTTLLESDLIVFSTNQDFTRYFIHNQDWKNLRWARGMDRAKIYASVWEHLFKLTPSLQDGLNMFVGHLYLQKDTLVKQENDYSSFSVPFFSRWHRIEGTTHIQPAERTGQHVRHTLVCGQFRMKRNPTMPRDNLPHDHLDVQAIWDFLQKYNDSRRYRIFVATDSQDIRLQAKQAFPETLLDIPGPILHSDLAGERKDLCQGITKALLDQLALASCDVLVRGYKSHLGAIAAYWRGLDTRLFCFNASTVEPCTMSDKGFHWGPEYAPGSRLHWKSFMTEIQRKANRMSLEEEEKERKRRRQRRKAEVLKNVVRDEREVVMKDGRMIPI